MANNPSHLPKQDKFVVLLHGLHQNTWFVQPLANYLKTAGFRTYTHRYYSLKDDIATHSACLHQYLCATHHTHTPIYIVAHSLGGLVARHFIANYPNWRIARVVTLGTPHMGSVSADYAKRLMPPLVGCAYLGALDGNCPQLPDDISLGVIAGSRPFGIGTLFLAHYYQKQRRASSVFLRDFSNDGTVYVHETQLPNAHDHLVLPVSHSGMLRSKQVHRQSLHFLEHGHFNH